MENTKYGKRREGRWIPIWVKAQDTRANPNSWETHLVRKRWDIRLLRALSLWIMMMMKIGCSYNDNDRKNSYWDVIPVLFVHLRSTFAAAEVAAEVEATATAEATGEDAAAKEQTLVETNQN